MNHFLNRRSRRIQLLSAAALVLLPGAAFAQAAAEDATLEEVIVTGTSKARAAMDTPLAVSALGEEKLQKIGASSQADILNTIPTIKADAGGGEVASNVFVRGLPSGGQYQFTPLMYDGIPVMNTFGLNSSAFDVYYRNDMGIERLEFVRGGVSNLFGPGSVAGMINYLSKTGGPEKEGVAQVEVANKGRVRTDLAMSGPISENTFYAFSGYYRFDEGPIKTDLDTKGFQLRGNVKHRFADDSGQVTFYGQYIDDQVQFYLPVPLDGSSRNRINGTDGDKVYSVQHGRTEGLGYNTPAGAFTSDIEDGVHTKGGQIAVAFEKEFADGWAVNGKAKYSDYKHKFGLWSDGDTISNVPETLAGYIATRRTAARFGTDIASYAFTYADNGQAVAANTIVFANRFTDRDRPMEDMSLELNVTKTLEIGGVEHNFTFGGFYSDTEAKDINITTIYLAEFANTPRLISLTTTTSTGATTIRSRNGLLDAGVGYLNRDISAKKSALYFADQMETEKFIFDIGGRIEKIEGDYKSERAANVVTDTTANVALPIREVNWGTGVYTTAKPETDEWALAAGALYKLTPDLNLYANASRGYFFPEMRSLTFNAAFQPARYTAEIIKQAEAGVKYSSGPFDGSVSALYTKLTNRRQVQFLNDPTTGGFIERVNLVGTESYGIEGTIDVEMTENLTFSGNITLQKAEYKAFDTAPAQIGNEVERQPNILYNAGVYYDNGRLDASLFTNYTGDNWTASNNTIELEGFNVVTFDVGYTHEFASGHTARLGFNVFNLMNTDATTEGSPRQDNQQATGGAYFVGRPVLPRRYTARLTVNF